jgi:hypothetical protein
MLLFAGPLGHARRQVQGIIGVRLCSRFPSGTYDSVRGVEAAERALYPQLYTYKHYTNLPDVR